MTIQETLKSFGLSQFREGQKEVIEHVLSGQSCLTLMPTGHGKSLCYLLPTRIQGGLTVVVSPLIALHQDQVLKAKKLGFRTAEINSSLSPQERKARYEGLKASQFDLIFVTPERFRKSEFLECLGKVAFFVIDEAHCISEWGHDFRPDYSRLGEIRKNLGNPVTLALTATATPDVQKDILQQLELPDGKTFHFGLWRKNLKLKFEGVHGFEGKIESLLMALKPEPTVVYFSLISTLEKVSQQLVQKKIPHAVYHGDLSDRNRKQSQEDFFSNKETLLLATPAFGLGVDKPDIRSIIHFEIPGTLEAYYQEAGRAGRDEKNSDCLLLYDEDDLLIQMDFIKWANPDSEFVMSVYSHLKSNQKQLSQMGIEGLKEKLHFKNRRDFRLETALGLLERHGSISGNLEALTLEIQAPPSQEYFSQIKTTLRLQRAQEKLLKMVEYTKTEECLLQFIMGYFGELTHNRCMKCVRCLPRP